MSRLVCQIAKPAEPVGGKMNGLRPPLTAPPVFAVGQLRSDSLKCCRPSHAFCRVVIRSAMYTAVRTRNRKYKREISLDDLTDEKHYPFGTKDEYFKAPEPEEEYLLTICGDTVVFSNAPLVEAP